MLIETFSVTLQDVDALGTVSVQPTTVKVKTHVPYYNLKVTRQFAFFSLMSPLGSFLK